MIYRIRQEQAKTAKELPCDCQGKVLGLNVFQSCFKKGDAFGVKGLVLDARL